MQSEGAMYQTIVVGVLEAERQLDHAIVDRFHVAQGNVDAQIQVEAGDVLVHGSMGSCLAKAEMVVPVAVDVLERIEGGDDVGVRWELDPAGEVLVVEDLLQDEIGAQLRMVHYELGFTHQLLHNQPLVHQR